MKKIIVITGGTSGIGLELKKLYQANNDTVITLSRKEDEGNHYVCDVSNEEKVKEVFNDIKESYGNIDVLINNAGFGMSGISELIPMEEIKSLFDTNYYGTLYCIRAALPFMTKGSKIVNISSAMALFPVPFRGFYASAKSAVLTLSFALRMELAPLGIDVTAICPGDIKTNFTKNRIKEFTTNERYGSRLETATIKSDSREDKRMSAEKCANKIFKCINKNKTKPFTIIGGKYKLLYFATRFTPKSMLLHFTGKMLGGTDNNNGNNTLNADNFDTAKVLDDTQNKDINT